MTSIERQVYSAKEYSIIVGVSLSQVYAAIKAGKIPVIEVGQRKNIPKPWVDKQVMRGTEQS